MWPPFMSSRVITPIHFRTRNFGRGSLLSHTSLNMLCVSDINSAPAYCKQLNTTTCVLWRLSSCTLELVAGLWHCVSILPFRAVVVDDLGTAAFRVGGGLRQLPSQLSVRQVDGAMWLRGCLRPCHQDGSGYLTATGSSFTRPQRMLLHLGALNFAKLCIALWGGAMPNGHRLELWGDKAASLPSALGPASSITCEPLPRKLTH